MLFSKTINRLNRKTAATVKAVTPTPASGSFIVRDNRTKQIIARGSEKQCRTFIGAFGSCHLDSAGV